MKQEVLLNPIVDPRITSCPICRIISRYFYIRSIKNRSDILLRISNKSAAMDTRTTFILMFTCFFGGEKSIATSFFPDFTLGNFSIAGTNFPCRGNRNEQRCFDDADRCILRLYWCDTIIDCPNAFDENPAFCKQSWSERCTEEEKGGKPFEIDYCENGMCITECDRCDGRYLDCTDGSDEKDFQTCVFEILPTIKGDCSSYRQQPNPRDIK